MNSPRRGSSSKKKKRQKSAVNINVPASVTLKSMLDISALVLATDQNVSNQASLLGQAVQERKGGVVPGFASMALPLPIPSFHIDRDRQAEDSSTRRPTNVITSQSIQTTKGTGLEEIRTRHAQKTTSSEITMKALLDACATCLSGQGEQNVVVISTTRDPDLNQNCFPTDCLGIISMVIDTVMQVYLRFEDGEIVQDVDEKLKLVESLVSMLPLVDSPQVTEMILKLIVCCFTALNYAPYGGMRALVHSYFQAVSVRSALRNPPGAA